MQEKINRAIQTLIEIQLGGMAGQEDWGYVQHLLKIGLIKPSEVEGRYELTETGTEFFKHGFARSEAKVVSYGITQFGKKIVTEQVLSTVGQVQCDRANGSCYNAVCQHHFPHDAEDTCVPSGCEWLTFAMGTEEVARCTAVPEKPKFNYKVHKYAQG